MIFCTYIRTERDGKLITISLILDDFSSGKRADTSSLLQKLLYKIRFHIRCIFPHELEHSLLEIAWENTGHSI